MRDDLDFLYQKAMRSKDVEFMDNVASLLIDAEMWIELVSLDARIDNFNGYNTEKFNFFQYTPTQSKFDFLVGDSQMGENWYRNR